MATLIPRTSGPQVQAELGPQVRNTAQVDLSPLSRTAGAVGQAAVDLFQQQKQRADLTAVMEARRELSDWEGATFNPANADGIAKYQGKNALQAHDALLGDLDRRVSSIRSRLSPEQQQRFDQVSFSFRDSVQGRLNSYADREYSAYEATERKATIDNIGQDAVSAGMSGDFGLADVRLQEAVGIASAAYQTQGMGAEAIKASERGIVSSVRKQTAAAMATRDPFAAEDYYHRYADQMTPEDRAQVERTLYPVVKDRAAYELAQSLADGRGAVEPLPAPKARGVPSASVAKAIDDAAKAEGLDAAGRADLYALAEQESGFRADAVNREVLDDGDQATGLFQYRATSAGGIDRKDAAASARRAAREYKERLAKGGRAFAIAAHFAGEGGADAVVNRGRSAQNPKTALYVRQVMGRSARWASAAGDGSATGAPVATAATAAPSTLADAIAAIPRTMPPDQRAAAEGYLRDIYAQRKDRLEQAKKAAAMSIYDKVAAAGASVPLSQVLAPAELALVGQDSSLAESINRYRKLTAEGAVIQDDPATVDELQRMQALRPTEFAKLPLGQYADKLSGKTLKAFAEDQTKVNDPAKRADYLSDADRVERGFQMLGIGSATDASGTGSEAKNAPRAGLRGEFRIAYQNAQTAFVQSTGKKPTPEQADVLLSATAKQFAQNLQAGRLGAIQEKDGKFKNNPKVKVGLYSSAAQFDLQVSQADRDAVRGAYTDKYGRPPTDAWVTQYLARKSQGAQEVIDNVLEGFDELSDEIESTRQVTLRSAYTGTSQKPEEAARANQLSDQLGQPFGVVAANLGDYEQDARRQEIDDAGRASPHVGEFLSDPRRMALASDEAPKLATYANSLVTGEARATAEPNILEQVIGGIVSGWQRGKANALSLLPDGPAVMDPTTGRLTTDRSAEEAALRADQERRAQAADVTSASTERGFQAFDRANKAGSFSGAVRELAGGGTDTLGAIAVTLGQSIGMGAPGLALTAATGGGSRVVTAASAGTGSGLTEFGASIADAMQDAKVDPTDAYAVGQFLRDPQKMAAARDKAAKRGVAIGVFDALTAGVAGHFINNARRSASSAILRTGAEAGVQLGGGAAGEATAQLLTEERLKWGDIIMEGLAEVPTGAVEVHANYRAARASGQVRWINERLDQVMQSGQSNDRLRAATELAGELKLGERSPEDMKALTAQVAGEDARVYLDAEQAQTLFQSAPQVLQDMVGGESALAEQLATGQVVIPMAEWMAAVPRLPNRDEILRNARTTAEGLSPAELESLDIDAMARELGVPLDAPAPDATAANARAQVQQSVMAQLVGTERYTPAQAESQAQLWGAMFGRLGEVTGQDPVALYERYAAGIDAAEAPADGADAAPRTLMQRGMDALRSLFGRPQVATDGRGQQTIERDGSAYVQRAGQWLLADDQGQARDFVTLDQARTEAERTGGEIVQDDPIDGQRQTWSVALPDTAAREVLAGDILFQGGAAPRGQIQIGPDRAMQISLFKGADLSTFLHESGHFFLEVYRDLATAEDASPQIRSDLDALLKWFGVESADQIGVDQHEQFARGFEAYLGEGKAPTPELQSVFSQFKQWILGVYRSLRNLDVELTDEVRGVFDRMLASQEEIEAAQARVGFEPIARDLAEAQALGMTERQFADYQAQVAAAREQAEADLMAQLQEADARARERWWKDELATIRGEVEAEVEATPIVRAYRVLTGRKEAGGEPVPEQLQGLKLDRAVLAATYGDGLLDKMGRVYARKGGTHPEEAAALLGFSSADELVQGLWTVRQTLAGVSAEADARMQARHGEPMTDGTLPQRALDAVHGSRKIQLLERELGVLADLAKEPRPNRRELKAVAQAVLAEKTARQIRPNEYLVAERKAARAAAQAAAAGRYADALQAKRQQALNAVLFAEARAVQQEVESKVGYIRRQMTPQARERLGKAGADYLEAMDTIADTYEFRDVSGRAVARRRSLRQWVEARQAEDDLTAVSDALLARVEAESVTNYADLPITEFRELHDAVTNIARLAKLKNKLLSNKDQRDWESAQAELASAIRGAIAEGKPLPLSDADLTAMQKVGATYTGLMDWVLRPETVVEWLDGGETGPWHDFLWNQAEAAQQQRIELRNRVGGMLEQTMKALTPAQRADLNRLVYVPSLGRSLSKNTIVSVALNMGNAGNRDKLMRGGFIGNNAEVVQFTPQNIAEMLGHLTPADAQMVQGIWDAVNSLWPDIVEQQRRLSGVAPEQVEPMPLIFTAADGSMVSLRGGYYPAVYDPRAGAGGVKQARAAEEQIMGGTFSRAMTSKGHTKERTEYAAPMLLDYHRVLSRHLNDVITDVSHRGYVKQALRVLEDQELKNLIQQRLSEGAYHSLYGSVKNSVRGASVSEPGSSMAEKIGDAVLTNTAVAALGFRLPLVFANTVVAPIQAAARVDPKYLATGYAAYYRSPGKMTEMIHSLSPFMEERANSLDSSYQVVLGKLSGKRGIRAAAMKMAMEVHRWTVPLAERAIWLGRYQQAQAQGVSVDEAVRLADKSIRTTQQAGAPKDLSAAERDPRYKWVRMFIGPMIIMNNRLQESGLRGLYLGRVQSPARALGTWLSAGVLSNAVFELLMMRGPDGGDDDEKGWDDWSSWLARKTLLFPFQTIPLLRDVAGGIDAAIEGKPSMGRPNPIVDAGVALAKFGQTAWKEGRDWIADDDEPDAEKLIKTGVRAAGPLTGIPSNQMLTTGEYLYDVGTGQYTPDNPAEAAAYLMYRRPKNEQ